MIIRNDDVSVDTDINELKEFCEICDRYDFKIIQAVTPLGETHAVDVKMTNDQIVSLGKKKTILDNKELVEFLKSRNDFIGVHGLWHTHEPSLDDIRLAKAILDEIDLSPTYFVTPFNEGNYGERVDSLIVSAKTQRLEDYLGQGTPTDPIIYLHSWRFKSWYTFNQLDQCLKRITIM